MIEGGTEGKGKKKMRHTRDADQNETTNGQPEIKAIVWRIGSSADSPNSNKQQYLWGWRVARATFDDLTLFSIAHSGGSKWSMRPERRNLTNLII